MGSFASWTDAIDYLAERAAEERFVFIFDEFPYAAKRNEALPSILQVAIDRKLKTTNLFLALCGSNQGLMESQVLGKKSPLYGRRTIQIRLQQLGYLDAAKMLPGVSPQEAFRFYGCFGGVPYYLELVDPALSLRENLARLYFDRMGFLYDEPFGLLRQELAEPALYGSVLRAIADGANRQKEIADRTGIPRTTLPAYLKTLENLGIIERVVPFGDNPSTSRKSLYRMRDACYDFWFRFVMPVVSSIESRLGPVVARELDEARITEYLGRRFERLCAEWLVREALENQLPLPIASVGAWWGTNPAKRAQDDLDVVAADIAGKRLIIGECKYRETFDESAEFADLETKRDLLSGRHAEYLYLFCKRQPSAGTLRKCAEHTDWRIITLEEMYEA